MAPKTIHIALIGGGNVGSAVYEIVMGRLRDSEDDSSHQSHSYSSLPLCIISKLCVRDPAKLRKFQIDQDSTEVVTDLSSVVGDANIDIVVEVTDGGELVKDALVACIKRGKKVVTSNTSLLAENMDEIIEAIDQRNNIFAFEAAVGCGIPIINSLQSCFTGDIIHEVSGILNGPTNYMLGRIEKEGVDIDEAYVEAQEMGYTKGGDEDIEGIDARNKITILAKLCFGASVTSECVSCTGIAEINAVDFEYAKLLGCTIKFVATGKRLSEYSEYDGDLSCYVGPKLVPLDHLFSSNKGTGNTIQINSENLGISSFQGAGLGSFAAANAVVSDVYRLAAGNVQNAFPLRSSINVESDYSSEFYIRITFQDQLGIIRRVGELAEMNGCSICSILQNPIKDKQQADFVVTLEECLSSQVHQLCLDIGEEDFAHSVPIFMPMLGS